MAGYQLGVALFGGLVPAGAGRTQSAELLRWDGTSWSNLCDDECVARSGSVPAARSHATLTHAVVGSRGVLLLHAGRGSAGYLKDLWEFDPALGKWTEKTSAPGIRALHGATFDPHRGKLFVHGGCMNDDCVSDPGAAEYDPATNTWSSVPRSITDGLPERKHLFGIAFDTTRGRIVEFGGMQNGRHFGRTVDIHVRGTECATDTDCHTGLCVKAQPSDARGTCATRCTAGDPDDGSGPCVDGYRCENTCAGACETCAANPGLCTAVKNAPDDDHCSGTQSCNDTGQCRNAIGQPCIADLECASGNCPEHGEFVCSVPGCGTTPCLRANAAGQCMASPRGTQSNCPDYLVCGDGGACLELCAADGDCVDGYYCDVASGVCQEKLEPGEACDRAAQCGRGFCTDGVCCLEACNEPCRQCGAGGKCVPRPDGAQPLAPRKACDGEGTCQGYCSGGDFDCIYPPTTTSCEPSNCSGDSCQTCAGDWRDGHLCNGQGQCVEHQPQPCGEYSCGDGQCFTECDDNQQCRGGAVCDKSGGRGVCRSEVAKCTTDGYHLELVSGAVVDCDGYRCIGDAQCSEICDARVADDCAPGFACQRERCVPAKTSLQPETTPAPADEGCSLSTAPQRSPGALLWIAVGWLLYRRRSKTRSDASV